MPTPNTVTNDEQVVTTEEIVAASNAQAQQVEQQNQETVEDVAQQNKKKNEELAAAAVSAEVDADLDNLIKLKQADEAHLNSVSADPVQVIDLSTPANHANSVSSDESLLASSNNPNNSASFASQDAQVTTFPADYYSDSNNDQATVTLAKPRSNFARNLLRLTIGLSIVLGIVLLGTGIASAAGVGIFSAIGLSTEAAAMATTMILTAGAAVSMITLLLTFQYRRMMNNAFIADYVDVLYDNNVNAQAQDDNIYNSNSNRQINTFFTTPANNQSSVPVVAKDNDIQTQQQEGDTNAANANNDQPAINASEKEGDFQVIESTEETTEANKEGTTLETVEGDKEGVNPANVGDADKMTLGFLTKKPVEIVDVTNEAEAANTNTGLTV